MAIRHEMRCAKEQLSDVRGCRESGSSKPNRCLQRESGDAGTPEEIPEQLRRAPPSRSARRIGCDGGELRVLRTRLDLDSGGYLSRLLRRLESGGLVTVAPSEGDGRVRTTRLTGPGLSEREVLDRRSDELARSILEPLRRAARFDAGARGSTGTGTRTIGSRSAFRPARSRPAAGEG